MDAADAFVVLCVRVWHPIKPRHIISEASMITEQLPQGSTPGNSTSLALLYIVKNTSITKLDVIGFCCCLAEQEARPHSTDWTGPSHSMLRALPDRLLHALMVAAHGGGGTAGLQGGGGAAVAGSHGKMSGAAGC